MTKLCKYKPCNKPLPEDAGVNQTLHGVQADKNSCAYKWHLESSKVRRRAMLRKGKPKMSDEEINFNEQAKGSGYF